jgi:hypothetical protein
MYMTCGCVWYGIFYILSYVHEVWAVWRVGGGEGIWCEFFLRIKFMCMGSMEGGGRGEFGVNFFFELTESFTG